MAEDPKDPRFAALQEGIVVENEDPKGLWRVRVTIAGLIEEASPWAWPLGTQGGGSKGKGGFSVPKKGATVGVLFLQGDPERPHYMPGHFGSPGGVDEVPDDAAEVDPKERHQIVAFETERYKMTYDDRKEFASFRIRDKKLSNTVIEFDGKKGAVLISAETDLIIRAKGMLDIDGTNIQIKKRKVLGGNDPI